MFVNNTPNSAYDHPDIILRDVSCSLGGQTILENVNLTIEHGEYLAVMGPNGGGKSTLLRLILGLVNPSSGSVSVFGLPPDAARVNTGYLPQESHVNRSMPAKVLEVVLLGFLPAFSFWPFPSRKDKIWAEECLERVGLPGFKNKTFNNLSGGQKQKVLIARALARRPKILLLDEPEAGVDPEGRLRIFELMSSFIGEMTVVLVCHDLGILSCKITSVVCVNKYIHQHKEDLILQDMFELIYGCPTKPDCPLEMVTSSFSQLLLKYPGPAK